MATVCGGIGSFFDNLLGGGMQPFAVPALTSSQQVAAVQAFTGLSGDGEDTFAGGTNTFSSGDVIDTVIGGSSSMPAVKSVVSSAGPTADGIKDTAVNAGTQVITLGDNTTVKLVGIAPVDPSKNNY